MKSRNFESQILEIFNLNPTMSYADISKKVGCSKCTVQYYFRKNHIVRDRINQQKLNNTDRNKPIIITEKAKEILVGTILGDATISKYRRNCEPVKILNSRISATHCEQQKDYVQYLYNLLISEGLKCNYTENNTVHYSKYEGRTIISKGYCQISTIRNIVFNTWRNNWYPQGIKTIPKDIIEKYLTPLAIAIWFMDDGAKNNCSYYLHTEGFTAEDVDFLRSILETKYNLKTARHTQRRKPVIYISGYSRENFTTLILPYICDSMKYKLFTTKLGLNKSDELLER